MNHIDALKNITSKTGLIRSLKRFYSSSQQAIEHKYTLFDSTPTSFIIEANNEDEEFFALVLRYKEITQGLFSKERVPEKHCSQNVWLVKPANLNQGTVFCRNEARRKRN